MPRVSRHRNHSKTYSTPKKPFMKPRLDAELKFCGVFGLKCKREVYRARYALAKIRRTARTLLTLDENDLKRRFEGDALLRRLHILGILDEDKNQLDYVLGLKIEDLLKRRLQSIVHDNGMARSTHEARVMIRAGHIQVGRQIVSVPSYITRVASAKAVRLADTSPLQPNSGRLGKTRRMKAKRAGGDADDE